MQEHRYTDDEVHAIFQRAAARQEEARDAEEASRAGLTLAELQEIGRAAGIAPAHVAAAALEVRRAVGTDVPATKPLLGMPMGLRAERCLPVAVTDEAWERIVADLRRLFDTDGLGGDVGRVREWTVRPPHGRHDRAPKVTLVPEGEGTRVVIEQRLRSTAVGLLAGSATYAVAALLFGLLLTVGSFDPAVAFLPVLFAVMGLVFFGVSTVSLRAYARRQEAKFERALDRIALIAHDAAPRAETPLRSPMLGLDGLPDAPEAERGAARNRIRE